MNSMYDKYNWRFDEKVVGVFDEHVNNSVPLYKLFHENIVNMSVYFTQLNTNIIDIGTSTGVLLNKLYEINKSRNVNCTGIDIEKAMIDECKSRYNNLNFYVCDAVNYDYTNSSVITAMLSLQFIQKNDRKKLLNKIYKEINEDGCLFIVEKIKSEIPDIHDIYNDLYYDFKRNNLDDNDILDKNQSLRGIMKPLTLSENIENLRNVGFEKIDVFMKYNNFVGIMAIK